ncbi:MAG: hypothetical protein HOW73_09445 [Polyangiaceae bacterium]|nr:hypothetical protein [Polyangiaceae bacterium]
MKLIALALATLAALVAIGNIAGIASVVRDRRQGSTRGYSPVPLLSLIFSATSWALGHTHFGRWLLLPAAIDPGTWMVPVALVLLLRNSLRPR